MARRFSGPNKIDDSEIQVIGEPVQISDSYSVYEGVCRAFQVMVEIPILPPEIFSRDPAVLHNEMNKLSLFVHPNLSLFLGACVEAGKIKIVMEHLEGTIEQLMEQNKYKLHERMNWALETAHGVCWLHGNRPSVIIRNFKLANLFYDKENRIKIVGWTQFSNTTGANNFSHLAPEILLNQSNFTEKVDVYSFGLILWHLLTKQAPYVNYTNEEAFIEDICVKDVRPVIPTDCPSQLGTLMTACWQKDPAKRPSFVEIVEQLQEIIQQCQTIEYESQISAHIEDVEGKLFWREYFFDQTQVPWSKFFEKFAKFMYRVTGEQLEESDQENISALADDVTEAQLQAASLLQLDEFAKRSRANEEKVLQEKQRRHVSGYISEQEGNIKDIDWIKCLFASESHQNFVTLDQFGKIISFLGPMDEDFINRVKDTLSEPYFHGDISSKTSEQLLGVSSREIGCFLVRFSGNTKGAYCISKRNSDRVVKHIIVPYIPSRGFKIGGTYYKSLRILIDSLKDKYGLTKPCPGSKFLWLTE